MEDHKAQVNVSQEELNMDMLQKLDNLLVRLSNMTPTEKKDLQDSYAKYREEESRGLYECPFELDIPDKLKN